MVQKTSLSNLLLKDFYLFLGRNEDNVWDFLREKDIRKCPIRIMPPQHFVMKLTLHEHLYANKKGILKAKSGVIILTLSDLAADL